MPSYKVLRVCFFFLIIKYHLLFHIITTTPKHCLLTSYCNLILNILCPSFSVTIEINSPLLDLNFETHLWNLLPNVKKNDFPLALNKSLTFRVFMIWLNLLVWPYYYNKLCILHRLGNLGSSHLHLCGLPGSASISAHPTPMQCTKLSFEPVHGSPSSCESKYVHGHGHTHTRVCTHTLT